MIKMFMKLRTGFIFIFNVLCAAFTGEDPESIKNHLHHQYIFMLLGSAPVKAACRALMKLTPGRVEGNVGAS